MRPNSSAPLIWAFTLLLLNSPHLSQASSLQSAINSRKSVVLIFAKRTEVKSSPNMRALTHPKTGNVIIAQKKVAGQRTRKGSGIILSSGGLIITNFHTINGADQIAVRTVDNRTFSAKIIAYKPKYDLAFLKIEPQKKLTPIELANSDRVNLGDSVTHIGSSDILKGTISEGNITGLGTARNQTSGVEVIQVNLNIYKGDSGGPLLNKKGELIGIMTAKNVTKNRESFAIPTNKIKKLYQKLTK